MKENVTQKFCRECYTTTQHKVVEAVDKNTGRRYEKTLCIKCSEARPHKRPKPKIRVSHKDIYKI